MQANSTSLLDFLSKPMKLSVPIYQRPYSWDEEQCKQLWNDIIRVGGASEEIDHFTGCIVLMPTGAAQPTAFEEFLIIDGQQRLTTVTLLLIALERLGDKKIEGLNPRRYIQNQRRKDSQEYKLELSNDEDKCMLRELLDGVDPKKETKLESNLDLFKKKLKGSNLDTVRKGLARLNVVSIILDSKRDDPQLVFESMNATGKGLSQADLIRNYALMGLEPDKQERLYKDYWRKMELSFGQEYSEPLDDFVRYFLIMKTKDEQGGGIYEKFKSYHRNICGDIEEILREMKKYSEFYNTVSLGGEEDPALNAAFKELTGDKGLNVKTTYPLLLKLYDQYHEGNLEKSEFENIVRLIVSYAFRRYICGMAAANSRVFMDFLRHFYDEVSFDSFEAHLAKFKDGSRRDRNRFPDDEEFFDSLLSKEIYGSGDVATKRCNYLLVKLENNRRKPVMNKEGETINPGEYEIEHIMPQTLESEWKRELGEHYAEIHEKYQHTLGNLTLTGNNSKLNNNSFKQKRDMEGGFAESPLRITRELTKYDKWNEAEIEERAERLAMEAIKIWAAPRGGGKELKQVYALDSLFEGRNSRVLYDALNSEIDKLGLKRQVGLTVISYWQSNKRVVAVNLNDDSIRVDIAFRKGRESVKDPENRLSFPSSKSHAGITIKSPDDIPYLMDLINQALEQDL